jgi:hypothetical protein
MLVEVQAWGDTDKPGTSPLLFLTSLSTNSTSYLGHKPLEWCSSVVLLLLCVVCVRGESPLLFILVVGRCGCLFLEYPHATATERLQENSMWQLEARGMKKGPAAPRIAHFLLELACNNLSHGSSLLGLGCVHVGLVPRCDRWVAFSFIICANLLLCFF